MVFSRYVGISLCLHTFFVRSLLCSAIRPKPYLLSLHTSVAMISTIYFFALLSINLEALQVMKLRLSLALLLLGAGGLSENPRRTELDFCPYERAASPPPRHLRLCYPFLELLNFRLIEVFFGILVGLKVIKQKPTFEDCALKTVNNTG